MHTKQRVGLHVVSGIRFRYWQNLEYVHVL